MIQTIRNAAGGTQPVIYGVAGASLFGVPLNDLVMWGTGLLLILNVTLAVHKWINIWRDKDAD